MEKQRGPDPDYVIDDLKLDHGWEETERINAERDRQAARKPKPKRFSTANDVTALEAVCGKPYEGNEDAWDAAMRAVKLPLCYQPAVREALSQHRWRNSQNPIGYVKSVAMRIGLKTGINTPDWHGKPKEEACTVSAMGAVLWDKNELYRDKEVSREDFIDNLQYAVYVDPDPDEYYLEDKQLEMLLLGLLDSNLKINWSEVSKRAGLKREQARVLSLKAQGLGRDAALETTRSEAGRKRLQSAWRDLEPDRKGKTILANVREVLSGRDVRKAKLEPQVKHPSYVPPREALEAARKRQTTPVVHETYESLNKKSYHLRWLQTI